MRMRAELLQTPARLMLPWEGIGIIEGAALAMKFTDDQENLFKFRRGAMVRDQLKRRGITDANVLRAMEDIPRHKYVPSDVQDSAYEDHPLAIGWNQTISQPYIVAYMIEALGIKETDRILEIGTGSGYQTAILARISGEVYTIERLQPVYEQAKKNLTEAHGGARVHMKVGDGWTGWTQCGPFHKILVSCAVAEIPYPLLSQISEGGKIIFPLEKSGDEQMLMLGTKQNGHIEMVETFAVRFVPLVRDDKRQ